MADGDFVVFDAQGNMLGNQTSNQGQVPLANALNDIELKAATLTGQPTASTASPATANTNSVWYNPATWKLPSISDVWTGLKNGPGATSKSPAATDAITSGNAVKLGLAPDTAAVIDNIQKGFADWLPRLVCMALGFIFVAVGLAMFGINTSAGQEVVRGVRNAIPRP